MNVGQYEGSPESYGILTSFSGFNRGFIGVGAQAVIQTADGKEHDGVYVLYEYSPVRDVEGWSLDFFSTYNKIRIDLNVNHYFKDGKKDWGFKPMIGIAASIFSFSYGYSFKISRELDDGLTRHNLQMTLFLPLLTGKR